MTCRGSACAWTNSLTASTSVNVVCTRATWSLKSPPRGLREGDSDLDGVTDSVPCLSPYVDCRLSLVQETKKNLTMLFRIGRIRGMTSRYTDAKAAQTAVPANIVASCFHRQTSLTVPDMTAIGGFSFSIAGVCSRCFHQGRSLRSHDQGKRGCLQHQWTSRHFDTI